MSDDAALRKQLMELLDGENAHITFDKAAAGFPVEHVGVRPSGSPHSAWELVEHLRIAQHDILAFCGGSDVPYQELKWPDEYWPASPAPATPAEWTKSLKAVRRDMDRFLALLRDPKRNLSEPFPWGKGQTLLREAFLIADHNAYHVGQLMLVRRIIEGSAAKRS